MAGPAVKAKGEDGSPSTFTTVVLGIIGIAIGIAMVWGAISGLGRLGDALRAPPPDPFDPPPRWSTAWWLSPMERNAFRRLPVVTGTIRDVFTLPDGVAIWLVGDDGLILHSGDGGETWQSQGENVDWEAIERGPASTPRPQPAPPQNLKLGADGDHAPPWFATLVPEARAADPKGKAPAEALLTVPNVLNRSLREARGVLTRAGLDRIRVEYRLTRAPQGQVVEQTPGPGARVRPGTPVALAVSGTPRDEAVRDTRPTLHAVHFADAERGWATGVGGIILATGDGGKTWAPQESGTDQQLMDVHFLDGGEQGWAVGGGGTALATSDGGQTWRRFDTGTRAFLQDVHFADAERGWTVGSFGTVLQSGDGGRTWTSAYDAKGSRVLAVHAHADGQSIWVANWEGTVLLTTDGGDTWDAVENVAAGPIKSLHFLADGQRGWATGHGGIIHTTDDGGRSWRAQESGTAADLLAIHATAGGGSAWAVGLEGTVLSSSDLGATWRHRTGGVRSTLRALHFLPDGQQGWATGGGGTVLRTADGGRTWVARPAGTTDALRALHVHPDGQRGWAVGARGPDGYSAVLVTTDGGRTWQSRGTGSPSVLLSVGFADDGLFGVASGREGTLLVTTDGGTTWERRQSGTATALGQVLVRPEGGRATALGSDGTVLRSDDGGARWRPGTMDTGASIRAGHSSTDGRRVWAAGDDGTVLAYTEETGRWVRQLRQPGLSFHGLDFDAGGKRGWAVGAGGAVLETSDSGENWEPRASGTPATLLAVQVSPDGRRAWAVGDTGAMRTTVDGGETWTDMAAPYARYPAPWFLALCGLLALGGLAYVIRSATREVVLEQRESIKDFLAPDRPLEPGDPDPLHFNEIAMGLSRFLRNRRTEPPLTVAVTGEWGTGKSSLMNLLRHDLAARGFTPVWFNAWHHQRGEHLLASLFANIRSQGIPGIASIAGVTFRLRLVRLRGARYWVRLSAMVLVVTGLYAYFDSHPESVQRGLAFLESVRNFTLPDIKDGGAFAAMATAVLWPLIAAFRALRAFGVTPTSMINAVTGGDSAVLKQQPGVRYRFAREFEEVTNALRPRTLVIFIDDLDRCRQENVVEVLEAVNFLVTCGDCYVVMGMAKGWVLTCIGLHFSELAAESPAHRAITAGGGQVATPEAGASEDAVAPMAVEGGSAGPPTLRVVEGTRDDTQGPDASPPEQEDADADEQGRYKRRDFATQYLEKLINIEVPVPRLTDSESEVLLAPEPQVEAESVGRSLLRSTAAGLKVLTPVFLVAALAVVGYLAGTRLPDLPGQDTEAIAGKEPGETTPAELRPGDEEPPATPGDTSPDDTSAARSAARAHFVPGQRDDATEEHVLAGTPAALAALAIALVLLFRQPQVQTDDSRQFRDALKRMHPWVTFRRRSPRNIKRFINRVRYVAMRERDDEEPVSLLDRVKAALKPGARRRRTGRLAGEGIDEGVLVGLAAIHNVEPEWLSKLDRIRAGDLPALFHESFGERFADPETRALALARLQEALDSYRGYKPLRGRPLLTDEATDAACVERFLRVMTDVKTI